MGDEPEPATKWRASLDAGFSSTRLKFTDGASSFDADERRTSVAASLEHPIGTRWTFVATAGAAPGGSLRSGTQSFTIEPGPLAAVGFSFRPLDERGARPFVLLSFTLGASLAWTHPVDASLDTTRTLVATDGRLGIVAGKTIAKKLRALPRRARLRRPRVLDLPWTAGDRHRRVSLSSGGGLLPLPRPLQRPPRGRPLGGALARGRRWAVDLTMSKPCPCTSGRAYAECCRPLHRGARDAETPEALMRSRFSAFAVGDVEYLWRTLHPEHEDRVLDKADVVRTLRKACRRIGGDSAQRATTSHRIHLIGQRIRPCCRVDLSGVEDFFLLGHDAVVRARESRAHGEGRQ